MDKKTLVKRLAIRLCGGGTLLLLLALTPLSAYCQETFTAPAEWTASAGRLGVTVSGGG